MSRIIEQPAVVVTDPDGAPTLVNGNEVLSVQKYYRIWVGALERKPAQNVWKVETTRGLLELHNEKDTDKWKIVRQAD